ncbi:hypothetical protein [Hydrogeniiclostridium mannosilyticum]|uniref:hypothetical protein n=1 Tax=Hydrogeniiclostridium mannosilyticum TaxID=2764322 RepID=UPI00399C2EFE
MEYICGKGGWRCYREPPKEAKWSTAAGQAEEARLKKAPVEKCKHSNGEAAFKNDICRYA